MPADFAGGTRAGKGLDDALPNGLDLFSCSRRGPADQRSPDPARRAVAGSRAAARGGDLRNRRPLEQGGKGRLPGGRAEHHTPITAIYSKTAGASWMAAPPPSARTRMSRNSTSGCRPPGERAIVTSSITAGASAGSREIGPAVQKFAAVSTVVVVSTGWELSVKGIIGLFGAAVVASLYVSAFAQAPPPGSYQYSCRDIRMRGTTLTAVCSRLNGSEQLTALNVARCVGDIGNADGQLICNGGQPAEPVADRCGDVDVWNLTSHIYVSPKGTDSDSCGASPSSPCGSIQRGIDRCGAKGCGVLVRYGLYSLTEPIRLREGVSVYGRCVFDGDSDRKYRSVIVAPPDGKPGIIADKILLRTVLDGVFVRGSDATSPGGASIAMTISNSIFRNPGPVGLAIAHTI